MSAHYKRTFVCEDCPGTSPNTICSLLQKPGRRQAETILPKVHGDSDENHVAIDRALKQNTDKENDLSAFSYKVRVKGCKDISVLYAYEILPMEPICKEIFPGKALIKSSYPAIICDNNLRKGIIMADKGFPSGKIENLPKERPDLHCMPPNQRNDKTCHQNLDALIRGSRRRENRYAHSFQKMLSCGRQVPIRF